MPELNSAAHVRYFRYFLHVLPTHTQSQDSNKLMLLYFAISSLQLLQSPLLQTESQDIERFILRHSVDGKGFRGSLSHEIAHSSIYDPPTLPATYAALCILHQLGVQVDEPEKIWEYVLSCQQPNGAFSSHFSLNGPIGDGDLRQCFLASAIRRLLGVTSTEHITSMENYILSTRTFTGGLGPYESHAGLTFCGLAALSLSDCLQKHDWSKTVDWLVHRQISFPDPDAAITEYEFSDLTDEGAFNGRENKFGDTCYAFWVIASLRLLRPHGPDMVNVNAIREWLLENTQSMRGGFGKSDEDDVDPLHSFLGVCVLGMLGEPRVGAVDVELVVPI